MDEKKAPLMDKEKESIFEQIKPILKSEAQKYSSSIKTEVYSSTKDYLYKTINTVLYKMYKSTTDFAQYLIYKDISSTRMRMVDMPSYKQNYSAPALSGSQPLVNYSSHSTKTTTEIKNSSYTHVGSLQPPRSPFDFDSIIYPNRETAEMYLDDMREQIAMYGELRVSQYFNMVGRDCAGNYTAQDYAWNNLDKATIEPTFEGNYLISLPTPRKL